ncbi:MAG: ABC transporter permease [Marinifilaceae bacterium]|jgi:ABC-2 type transport system permease protein|nr:ABC transporter permease [Marinifilaceae bacterium]
MNKIFIIIKREYISRVRKKSFIILSLLTPLLIAGIYAFIFWLMSRDDTENREILIANKSELIKPIKDSDFTKYKYQNISFEDARKELDNEKYYAFVYIPKDIMTTNSAEIYSHKQITIEVKSQILNQLKNHIENIKRDEIFSKLKDPEFEKKLAATKTKIKIKTIKLGEDGEIKQGSTEIAMAIGFMSAFIIYMFIFMYGVQVMRGVIEEKTNRIIEVIVSSVKPFQLMMGKIIGVALVGLTQFLIWIVLSIIVISALSFILGGDSINNLMDAQNGMQQIDMNQLQNIDSHQLEALSSLFDLSYIISILAAFIFFFLGGYLLYSALFAAIGSAVDNETETQQFMLPVSLPLILAMYIGFAVAQNPESSLAFWGSIIPFTSPIVMLVRIPYGVPIWELLLSGGILILSFILITWIASKIYRIGILMYGKKVSYLELWKWIRYKS